MFGSQFSVDIDGHGFDLVTKNRNMKSVFLGLFFCPSKQTLLLAKFDMPGISAIQIDIKLSMLEVIFTLKGLEFQLLHFCYSVMI